MKNRFRLIYSLFLVVVDLLMINASVVISYLVRFQGGIFGYVERQEFAAYYPWMLIESVILPLLFFLRGMYRFQRRISRVDEFQRVFAVVSIGTLLTMAVSAFLARDFVFSRFLVVLAWALGIVLIWLGRFALDGLRSQLLRRGADIEKVLVVGSGEMARVIMQRLRSSPELGYRLEGYVGEAPAASGGAAVAGFPFLGSLDDVATIVRERGIGEVIIADPNLSHRRILDIVGQCDQGAVTIKVFPDVFQIISTEASLGDLNGLPMMTVRDAALRGWKLGLKRGVDTAISLLVLLFLSPVMLLAALLIKLTSPEGAIFYIQERVGLDGVRFPVIKFRSMVPHAEAETGPVWAQRGDPRVTLLGRFLRRFSLDELPQFINVLVGQMSVVGPRPERPHFVEQFSQQLPRYLERHREKAGVTGWAQVNGLRGNVSIEERTAYDIWYVENWTLGLDFKIMLRTLIGIFRDKNAY